MEIEKQYALIQWEDFCVNVIDTCKIIFPRKNKYKEGEYIRAKFQGRLYSARLCELDGNRSVMVERMNNLDKSLGNLKNPYETSGSADHETVVNDDQQKSIDGEAKKIRNGSNVDQDNDYQLHEIWKRKLEDFENSNAKRTKRTDMNDQAKASKADDNKKKREKLKQRAKTLKDFSAGVFGEDGEEINPEETGLVSMMTAIKEIGEKVDTLTWKVEEVFNCKACLRKLYKKLDVPQQQSPPPPQQQNASPVHHLIPQLTSPPRTLSPGADDNEMTFIGKSRYGIRVTKEKLIRCEKSAKTPEKLALNLIEFLITPEEYGKITVYANKQHDKEPMEENKRRALRSHIFTSYPHCDKNLTWEKTVKCVNDKMRKLLKK